MTLDKMYKRLPDVLRKTYARASLHCFDPQILNTAADVEALLPEWSAAEGWLCRESDLQLKRREDPVPKPADAGHVLAAEFSLGARSLHIRQKGASWVAVEYSEEGNCVQAVLADEVTLVGTARLGGPTGLVYRRFWQVDADLLPVLFAARFCGFRALDGGTAG